MSIESLVDILNHEALGQRARWERYVADLLFTIAAGKRIDDQKVERFGVLVDEVHANPFKKIEKPMTAEEIKQYILKKLEV